MSIEENLDALRRRIDGAAGRAGRDPESVELVAVVKNRALEEIEEVRAAGRRLVAFNRVQEAREKIPQLSEDLTWHMIGHIQTNKAKFVPRLFRMAHAVDTVKVAVALDKAQQRLVEEGARPAGERFDVLLEVNVSGEASKQGMAPGETEEGLRETAALEHLRVRGLMTMAPFVADPEETRPVFRALRELRDRLRDLGIEGVRLDHLSMGMTNDFEVAIEEGATLVRVGTAIFEGF